MKDVAKKELLNIGDAEMKGENDVESESVVGRGEVVVESSVVSNGVGDINGDGVSDLMENGGVMNGEVTSEKIANDRNENVTGTDGSAGKNKSIADETVFAAPENEHAAQKHTLNSNFDLPWDTSRYLDMTKRKEYLDLYEQSIRDSMFFLKEAKKRLSWSKEPTHCTNGDLKALEYFNDGEINACYNAVDRHPPGKTALIYDNDDGTSVRYTYGQCKARICEIAGALLEMGICKGDVVCVYMPMIDDTVFVALACARIGAVHNVVFGGYSKESVVVRIKDSGARVLVSVMEGRRGTQRLNFYKIVEEIVAEGSVGMALIVDKEGSINEKDHDNKGSTATDSAPQVGSNPKIEILSKINKNTDVPCTPVPSEHPLFILYTSGSTGKPKGIIHSTAGYLLYAHLTTQHCFSTDKSSVFCCTADLGWITGHSYVLYGPMCVGMVSVIVGGLPTYPDVYRMWRIIERYGVTHFYTAPTLLRLLRKLVSEEERNGTVSGTRTGTDIIGDDVNGNANPNTLNKHSPAYVVPSLRNYKKTGTHRTTEYDLSSLQILGSVGEPINKETYVWYSQTFNRRPMIDCYWQTETGGIVVCPVPYVDEEVAECAGRGFLGVRVFVVTKECIAKGGGNDDGDNVAASNPGTTNNPRSVQQDRNRTMYSYWSDEIADHFKKEGLRLADENELGLIVLYGTWPGMTRTILNDHARFVNTYVKHGVYFTGDEGVFYRGKLFVRGRADDVINVSGHRVSTAEVESVCAQYVDGNERVMEVAMVGAPDEITGLSIVLFVVGDVGEEKLRMFLKRRIGAIINPKRIYFVKDLPKTRTGKIMRRVLKGLICGEDVGDLSTIGNEECIDEIRKVVAG